MLEIIQYKLKIKHVCTGLRECHETEKDVFLQGEKQSSSDMKLFNQVILTNIINNREDHKLGSDLVNVFCIINYSMKQLLPIMFTDIQEVAEKSFQLIPDIPITTANLANLRMQVETAIVKKPEFKFK